MDDFVIQNSSFCDEFFNCEETEIFIDALCKSQGKEKNSMSDFELFSFVSSNIALCSGSDFKRKYIQKIACAFEKELGENPAKLLRSREMQKEIWLHFYRGFDCECENEKEKICVEKYNLSEKYTEKSLKCENDEKYNLLSNCIYLNEREIVKCIRDKKTETLSDFVEQILVRYGCFDEIKCVLSCEAFEMTRADAYHSELIFKKIISGEKCISHEISQLLLWILSSLMLRRKIKVILCGENSLSHASRLNEYLYPLLGKHPSASFDIYICVEAADDMDELLNVMQKQKNISPAFAVINEKNEMGNPDLLAEIVLKYPIGCVEYFNLSRSINTEKLSEYLFELLSEVCDDQYDLMICYNKILNGSRN